MSAGVPHTSSKQRVAPVDSDGKVNDGTAATVTDNVWNRRQVTKEADEFYHRSYAFSCGV